MVLLHPFTHERMTPDEAYTFCLEALRSDDNQRLSDLYFLRLSAHGEHRKAIDRAFDDRLKDVIKPAGSYLPGEVAP